MPFELAFQSFPTSDGPLHYAYVPWDSELYGFPFLQLKCECMDPDECARHLPSWLSSLPVDRSCLVYSKIPAGAVALGAVLTSQGFYPVEILFELYLPLARLTPLFLGRPAQRHLRLAEKDDLPRVVELARSAFEADRFHLDPNLLPERADARYARWVERAFDAGEPLFLYGDEPSAGVLGFIHARETAVETIDLCLGAVSKTNRGAAVGVLMFQSVLIECQRRGYKRVTTRSAVSNLPIINLLTRLGFRFGSAVMTLHWFRSAAQKS